MQVLSYNDSGGSIVFKVLVIEDEAGIRKSMIKGVDWNDIGCEICGEADSGLTGLEKYFETNPDIIITDIVMPGIDGITFLKYIRSKNENVKVLLITGHRDFEYAMAALNLGASRLLLKPINYNQLMDILKDFVIELKREKSSTRKKESVSDKEFERLVKERDNFMLSMIKGNTFSQKYVAEQTERFSISFSGFFIVTAGLDINNECRREPVELCDLIQDLYTVIKNITGDDGNIITINVDNTYICMVIGNNDGSDTDCEHIFNYIKFIQNRIRGTFQHNLSFGVSRQGSNMGAVNECYRESLRALEERFFSGENSINFFESRDLSTRKVETLPFLSFDTEVLCIVKKATGRELIKEIHMLFDRTIGNIRDKSMIRSIVIGILAVALKKICAGDEKNAEKILERYNYFKMIVNCNYIYRIKDIFTSVILDLHDYISKKKDSSKKDIIRIIIEFLEANYDRDISLNDVADYVYFSSSYISSFIKNETGRGFTDILNEIRIERAKDLLRTGLRTYEVAEKVGISDPHYFSQVFKKVAGKTPTEFMESIKAK